MYIQILAPFDSILIFKRYLKQSAPGSLLQETTLHITMPHIFLNSPPLRLHWCHTQCPGWFPEWIGFKSTGPQDVDVTGVQTYRCKTGVET